MPWTSAHGVEWWEVKRLCCGAIAQAVLPDRSRFFIPHETSCRFHRWASTRRSA